jgi:hypothetical protein
MNMPGMNHGNMNAAGMYLMNMASGTSVNPESWQMPMLMPATGRRNGTQTARTSTDLKVSFSNTGRSVSMPN